MIHLPLPPSFALAAEIEIPGRPVPQQRHRQGGKFLYDPSAKIKKALEMPLKAAMRGQGPLSGPVGIEIVAHMDGIKRRRIDLASGRERTIVRLYRIASPGWAEMAPEDADNLAKLILDAANGIWFEDDRQVVFLGAQKVLA